MRAGGESRDWRRGEPKPVTIYNLGCALTRLSGVTLPGRDRERLAERALVELRKAFQAGFRGLSAYRDNGDLRPLRDRTDFQWFLLNVVFLQDPFAHQRGSP
jgi:hypothetical protein